MSYPVGRYSEDTQILQRALIAAGFDVGKAGADGKMGDDTIKAIGDAREHYGLPAPRNKLDLPLLIALGVRNQPRKELPMETVLANVKSAWLSKLNWTLAAGALFNIFAFFGLQVPNDVKDAIVMVGNGVVLIAAWVIKTWFTTSISAASAKKL